MDLMSLKNVFEHSDVHVPLSERKQTSQCRTDVDVCCAYCKQYRRSVPASPGGAQASAVSDNEARRYNYQPLSPQTESRFSIRVLKILPADSAVQDGGVLHCTLTEVSVPKARQQDADCERYEALSYCWGPADRSRDILIDGKPCEVRENLWNFLETRRKSAGSAGVALWADALCINQKDLNERAKQVQFMDSVYFHAQKVLVWLGTGIRRLENAVKMLSRSYEVEYEKRSRMFRQPHPRTRAQDDSNATSTDREQLMLRRLGESRAFRNARSSEYETKVWLRRQQLDRKIRSSRSFTSLEFLYAFLDEAWPQLERSVVKDVHEGVRDLIDLPYWRRMWIVQEIFHANESVICYGQEQVPLDFVCDLICWPAWQAADRGGGYWLNSQKSGDWGATFEHDFQDVWRFLLDKENVNPAIGHRLGYLLAAFAHMGCSDARDRVYAVRSMLSWSNQLHVDYTEDKSRFFLRILPHIQRESGLRPMGSENIFSPRFMKFMVKELNAFITGQRKAKIDVSQLCQAWECLLQGLDLNVADIRCLIDVFSAFAHTNSGFSSTAFWSENHQALQYFASHSVTLAAVPVFWQFSDEYERKCLFCGSVFEKCPFDITEEAIYCSRSAGALSLNAGHIIFGTTLIPTPGSEARIERMAIFRSEALEVFLPCSYQVWSSPFWVSCDIPTCLTLSLFKDAVDRLWTVLTDTVTCTTAWDDLVERFIAIGAPYEPGQPFDSAYCTWRAVANLDSSGSEAQNVDILRQNWQQLCESLNRDARTLMKQGNQAAKKGQESNACTRFKCTGDADCPLSRLQTLKLASVSALEDDFHGFSVTQDPITTA